MPSIGGPTVPGTRKVAWCATTSDLGARGYQEDEYLLEGEASGRGASGEPVDTRAYRTRVIVRRPSDGAQFNDRVLVEWMNVSMGYDVDVVYPGVEEMLLREGWAYVGVSAQPVGVNHLVHWDAERYGTLVHPGIPAGEMPRFVRGETYSDDVFSDVARLLRSDEGDGILGGKVERLLAYGQSQSSGRLASYLADAHPAAGVYDGFLLHAGGGMRFRNGDIEALPITSNTDTPVLHVNSEAEAPRFFAIRQPSTDTYRYWEVAGSGHTPVSTLRAMLDRAGRQWGGESEPGPIGIEYALRAAIQRLDEWAAGGAPAPEAAPIDVRAGDPHEVVRDELGNARGGLRLPHVEAPLGRFTPSNGTERLMPGFEPFDAATLALLYPSDDSYVEAVDAAAARATDQGVLLPADAELIRSEARARRRQA